MTTFLLNTEKHLEQVIDFLRKEFKEHKKMMVTNNIREIRSPSKKLKFYKYQMISTADTFNDEIPTSDFIAMLILFSDKINIEKCQGEKLVKEEIS